MEPTTSAAALGRAELDPVRIRRAELRETINLTEAALAAPASGRAVIWGEAVHASLVMIADDFEAHIEVTEGPGGLHESIVVADTRLVHAVDQLTAEHAVIAADIAALVSDSEAPVTPSDVDGLREAATALISQLIRHRQRGADLIYEAYETDIGVGD